MSKKTVAIVIAIVMAVALFAGCTAQEQAVVEQAVAEVEAVVEEAVAEVQDEVAAVEEEAPAEEAAATDLTFGYIAYDMADSWNQYSAEAFEYAAAQMGVETIVLDSRNDIAESISAMESLIQQGVDGVSIFPISQEQSAQLVSMANEAGIPVAIENIPVIGEEGFENICGNVACRYADIGYTAINWIAENIEDPKIFFVAGAVGGGVYEEYQKGVDLALEELGDAVTMAGTEHGDWATEPALNVTQNFIQTGTEFNVVFANNGLMAIGAYQALEEAGMSDIPIVSTGGSPDEYALIEDGTESANMTAPVSIQGVQTFKNLYDFVTTGAVAAEFQPLPVIPITLENIDEWVDWTDFAGAYEYVFGA